MKFCPSSHVFCLFVPLILASSMTVAEEYKILFNKIEKPFIALSQEVDVSYRPNITTVDFSQEVCYDANENASHWVGTTSYRPLDEDFTMSGYFSSNRYIYFHFENQGYDVLGWRSAPSHASYNNGVFVYYPSNYSHSGPWHGGTSLRNHYFDVCRSPIT